MQTLVLQICAFTGYSLLINRNLLPLDLKNKQTKFSGIFAHCVFSSLPLAICVSLSFCIHLPTRYS